MALAISKRQVVDELMDAPALDAAAHAAALAGLRRINLLSRTVHGFVGPIVALARAAGLARISMLDVASGGGDVPVGVARALAARGIAVELTLFDRSATALALAAEAAGRAGVRCRAIAGDAEHLPEASFDVITNSLFLHHLREGEQVVRVLRAMSAHARRMVLVSDLRRSTPGLVAAWTGCRILSRSPIVHYDGPASVRAAFTLAELRDFAARAGLAGADVRPCFPFRMLLTWRPEAARD